MEPAKTSYTVHKKQNHIVLKERVDKLGFIKMKNFCSSEDTNNRVKRQTTDWEKIFAIHIQQRTHPEYKKILKINFKKAHNPIKNGQS